MAIPEFISVLRKIRDVIYPEVNATYEDSLVLKESIDVGKAEFDADLIQFNTDYSDFNIKKSQVDESVLSASQSASSASQSALTATNKSNEIKAITAQSTTGAPGTSASASYNPTDGKFTFVIPQGSKGDKGESFTVNSSGITANRTLYDAQPAGWSFLDITTSTLYFKVSSTSGDWSSGVPFGKGDKGDKGDTGVGITSFTFVSTTDVSGLPAKSGATDTYRVTLTNATTFDYNIYNGLDYSQELLDDKLDKDFSAFTDKTTPVDTDIIATREAGGTTKKLSWANLKSTLKTYFDSLYSKLTPVIATGNATFTATTNNINLTGIGVGVEIGDVIKISGATDSKNNSEFTIEVITDANNIIVNQAHAGKGTTKNLATRSSDSGVTVKLLAKWYNASEGLGQGWVDVSTSRATAITYQNNTNRKIKADINVSRINSGVQCSVIGLVNSIAIIVSRFQTTTANSQNQSISLDIPIASSYSALLEYNSFNWLELR